MVSALLAGSWSVSTASIPPVGDEPPTGGARPTSGTGDIAPIEQEPVLRVVAYNIKHGRGMDDAVDLTRVADVLRALDADVIALQEVDDRTERTGRVDQTSVLAELLGYQGFHGPHRPFQGGAYGNAVLTRLPVVEQRTHPIPAASGSALAVHQLVVDVGGVAVSVVSVHLAGSVEERTAQAERITAIFARSEHPVVLAGDFNGRPNDPALRTLATGWTVFPKRGEPGTYPADAPDREIDFIMTRKADTVEPVLHEVVEEPVASDHRPVLAVLRLTRPPYASNQGESDDDETAPLQ